MATRSTITTAPRRLTGQRLRRPGVGRRSRLHAICEKTGQINEPPVYYDDEELDRFAGRGADDYSDDETEEFRDVLLTLRPSDAPGWSVSLEKRRIVLPADLIPELELLLAEADS